MANRAKYRRPENRVALYFNRLVNRLETGNKFVTFPRYISSVNNILRDELSRLRENDNDLTKYINNHGLLRIDSVETPKWLLRERMRQRSLIRPAELPDRVRK